MVYKKKLQIILDHNVINLMNETIAPISWFYNREVPVLCNEMYSEALPKTFGPKPN